MIQVFETKYLRKLLHISYFEHKINDWVRNKISFLVGSQEPLLATVKRQKLAWLWHFTCNKSLQNCSSGHLGRWAMLWSAEETLDGQHQRDDIPAHARTAHKGLLQKRLEDDLC